MLKRTTALASVAILTIASVPVAASPDTATATTDLNMRMGPGPQFKIIDVIPAEAEVGIEGCVASLIWCRVNLEDEIGWAYARYLAVQDGNESASIKEANDATKIMTIEYDDREENAELVSAGFGGLIGSLVAGPAGLVAGVALGGVAANEMLDDKVVVYVRENPVEPVFLSGGVVVGAAVPEKVEVYDLPEHEELAYLNVNGDLVVIDRESRKIMKVVR